MEGSKKVRFDDFPMYGPEDSFVPPGGNINILLRAR